MEFCCIYYKIQLEGLIDCKGPECIEGTVEVKKTVHSYIAKYFISFQNVLDF